MSRIIIFIALFCLVNNTYSNQKVILRGEFIIDINKTLSHYKKTSPHLTAEDFKHLKITWSRTLYVWGESELKIHYDKHIVTHKYSDFKDITHKQIKVTESDSFNITSKNQYYLICILEKNLILHEYFKRKK